jgi:hypothetical protein
MSFREVSMVFVSLKSSCVIFQKIFNLVLIAHTEPRGRVGNISASFSEGLVLKFQLRDRLT